MSLDLLQYIKTRSQELFEEVRSIREHIHMHPELSYEEHETKAFIEKKLSEYGIPYKSGIGGTGVVGYISNGKEDNTCVALRADMDALPILEQNDVSYKSIYDGKMHACGHDVHTAILLGAAKILTEISVNLDYSVKLIFQPGEEKNPGGASLMIADGVLENPKVQRIYGLHVFPDMPVGQLGVREGMYMASCDEIYLTIHGIGGHGATPHNCVDPIVIGAGLILELQQIVSRRCDPKTPCVLTFGHFEALGATNIIPEKAVLKGTFRTMDEEWREKALDLISTFTHHHCEGHGAKAELTISRGYPVLTNDPSVTRDLKERFEHNFGRNNIHDLPIRLASEDFSFYSQQIPASFFRIGVRNDEKGITYGVHHPKFNIDEEALIIGVQAMCIAALEK
jgi:amidohydrolase